MFQCETQQDHLDTYLFRPKSCFSTQYLLPIKLQFEISNDLSGAVLVDFLPADVRRCQSVWVVTPPLSVAVIQIPSIKVGYDEPVTLLVKFSDS